MSDMERKARWRVGATYLGMYKTTIFANCYLENWEDHMKWVANAHIQQIVEWAEGLERNG